MFAWRVGNCGFRLRLSLIALALLCIAPAARLSAQQARHTISLQASTLSFDDALEFDAATLLGLLLTSHFGPWVALEGHFRAADPVRARFGAAGLQDTLGASAVTENLRLTSYGLALRVNFATGRISPFARAGASIIRFDSPEDRIERTLALGYGGGMRVRLGDAWRGELFAEEMRFRLNRAQLAAGVGPGGDPGAEQRRRNLQLGASLGYEFGGARREPAEGATRFSLVSLPAEVFGGQLRFASDAVPDILVAGARVGLDFGPMVGVQAYHLRRVGPFDGVQGDVSNSGVEMKFNLNAVPVLAPYLVVGAGKMDFTSDFLDRNGNPRLDHAVFTLGGGIGWRFTDAFRLNIAVRDMVHVAGDEGLNTVGSTTQLRHNLLYSAGLGMSIGRTRRGIKLVRDSVPPHTAPERTVARAPVPRTAADSIARTPTPRADADSAAPARIVTDSAKLSPRNFQSATLITIPLPQEGEVYLRYGPVDTSRVRTVREADRSADSLWVQELVRRELARQTGTAREQGTVNVQPPTIIVTPGAAPAQAPSPVVRTPVPAPAPTDSAAIRRLMAERDGALRELAAMRARLDSLAASLAPAAPSAREPALPAEPIPSVPLPSVPSVAPEHPAPLVRSNPTDSIRAAAITALRARAGNVVQVESTVRGIVLKLGGGAFSSDGAVPTPELRDLLQLVARVVLAYDPHDVAVEGHTDSIGEDAYNLTLSARRATFIETTLVRAGVPSARITARGYGPHHPVADNGTADGRARNRRVEVVILGAEYAPRDR